jgi:hypothetical protein
MRWSFKRTDINDSQTLSYDIDFLSNQNPDKNQQRGRRRWLTPVILATQESEIRRITVLKQAQANSLWEPILKIPNTHKKGLVKVQALCSSSSTTHTHKKNQKRVQAIIDED